VWLFLCSLLWLLGKEAAVLINWGGLADLTV
jgi:hypothetical protein